ncbi:uncharacterized protein LOC112591408 [Melanaphis sacchari]|uniref:uncharacterized protein LOC112591408 n=1 Tax=Melanaphis sacchari TaxID=742174 RepID=UPI000DC14811|nr:uncharacterized protein LOC112591408 [Melanaphis sacchari]
METPKPDKTHLKKNSDLDNLLTKFDKLSLAGAQDPNQIIDHIDTSDIIYLPKPNNDNPEELLKYNETCLKTILNSGAKEISKDLKYIDHHLYYLNRNIYQSLSKFKSNVIPKTSHNALIHLVAFQTFLNDHGYFLAGCEQWPIVVDYVFMAWNHVFHMPILNSLLHKEARSRCFCLLLRLCWSYYVRTAMMK